MPTKPDQPGEKGPQEESRRSTDLHSGADLGGEVEDRRDQEDQGQEGLGLPHEVGPRPLTHGVGHLAHLGGALVGADHLADQHAGIAQARRRRSAGSGSNRSARGVRTPSKGRTTPRSRSAADAAAAGTGAAGAGFAACRANSHAGADKTADAMAT